MGAAGGIRRTPHSFFWHFLNILKNARTSPLQVLAALLCRISQSESIVSLAEITGPVVARLTRLLQAGQHLATLDLPGNPIGSEGALAIGGVLASDTMLASLDLSGCSIGNDDLLLLAQGLRKNTRLRHLGLGMNHDLTSTGISALASALKAHQRIASLNLRGLSINSVGVQALADGLLANHPTLELLDLSDCVIGPKGIRILVGAMQTNTRLKNLVMDKRAHWSEPGDSD